MVKLEGPGVTIYGERSIDIFDLSYVRTCFLELDVEFIIRTSHAGVTHDFLTTGGPSMFKKDMSTLFTS